MTQKEALDILKTGRSVFLTGAAGSGKTHVLREYISYLKDLDAHLGITASTGIAATQMGGVTIHSWSGIGIRDYLGKSDLQEIAEKQHIKSKIKKASVLIIDEISMLHHFRLDLVNAVLKEVKNSHLPFGGMQIVLTGDFFQLPPVQRAGERDAFFAYHSDSWKELEPEICYLSEQHRQNDQEYLKILNAIRSSSVSPEIVEILKGRFGKKSELAPTKLYSHNIDVNSENDSELGKINDKVVEYEMHERGRHALTEALKKSCLAPETLRLKVGAKVMFVKNNFEEGYVNGTLGTVIKCGFEKIEVRTLSGSVIDVQRETWRIEEDGKVKAEIDQYPLRLAWAITVHKSQGMSLDAAEIDLRDSFERGMGYVALSRVRSLAGLFLKGFNDMALRVNEEVLDFDSKFRQESEQNAFNIRTKAPGELEKMHQRFAEIAKGPASAKASAGKEKLDTVTETKDMLDQGLSIKEIARSRGLKAETILDHIEKIKERDPKYNIYNLQSSIPKTKFREIYNAFRKVGVAEGGLYKLAPVKDLLGPKFSYKDIRLVRLFL